MQVLRIRVLQLAVDESQQLQRLMIRDQLNQEEAQARMDAQWPLARKRLLADVVISNHKSTATLDFEIGEALKKEISN